MVSHEFNREINDLYSGASTQGQFKHQQQNQL